jgi:hypothetical protein
MSNYKLQNDNIEKNTENLDLIYLIPPDSPP